MENLFFGNGWWTFLEDLLKSPVAGRSFDMQSFFSCFCRKWRGWIQWPSALQPPHKKTHKLKESLVNPSTPSIQIAKCDHHCALSHIPRLKNVDLNFPRFPNPSIPSRPFTSNLPCPLCGTISPIQCQGVSIFIAHDLNLQMSSLWYHLHQENGWAWNFGKDVGEGNLELLKRWSTDGWWLVLHQEMQEWMNAAFAKTEHENHWT